MAGALEHPLGYTEGVLAPFLAIVLRDYRIY